MPANRRQILRRAAALLAASALIGAGASDAASGDPATRSADVLALAGVGIGGSAVLYSKDIEKVWTCTNVDDDDLGIKNEQVQVDPDGKVVLDYQGRPFRCGPNAGKLPKGEGGGFPVGILLGVAGAGAAAAAAAGGGSGSPDSPG